MSFAVSRALLCTAILLPAVGAAQESRPQSPQFSYNYVELSYDENDYDLGGAEIDGDGLTLSGSFELTEDWHAFASYGTADLDFGIDFDAWALGAGYVYPLRDDVDIYGRVLYVDAEFDAGPGTLDEDGLGLQARIRYRVTDEFEVEGGVQHLDVFDSDTSLQAFARYYFTEGRGELLGLTFAGDTDGIGISARYQF